MTVSYTGPRHAFADTGKGIVIGICLAAIIVAVAYTLWPDTPKTITLDTPVTATITSDPERIADCIAEQAYTHPMDDRFRSWSTPCGSVGWSRGSEKGGEMNEQIFLIDRLGDVAYGPFYSVAAANTFAAENDITFDFVPGIGTAAYLAPNDIDANTTVIVPTLAIAA